MCNAFPQLCEISKQIYLNKMQLIILLVRTIHIKLMIKGFSLSSLRFIIGLLNQQNASIVFFQISVHYRKYNYTCGDYQHLECDYLITNLTFNVSILYRNGLKRIISIIMKVFLLCFSLIVCFENFVSSGISLIKVKCCLYFIL